MLKTSLSYCCLQVLLGGCVAMMMWHDVHSRDFDRNKLDELGNFKLHSFSHPDKDRPFRKPFSA